MKRTLIVLGLLLSATARPAHSQNPGQPPAGGPGQMPVATGEIRGVVMDWNLGDGLATLVAIDDGAVRL